MQEATGQGSQFIDISVIPVEVLFLSLGWVLPHSNNEINANRKKQENAKDHFRYICVGSLDDPEALPPKGEFFCKARASWMPEISGESFCNIIISRPLVDDLTKADVFHKQEIKE
jgi:hypothetical protein